MSTSIAAGVDDIPCFIALILKFSNLSLYLLPMGCFTYILACSVPVTQPYKERMMCEASLLTSHWRSGTKLQRIFLHL